MKKFIISAFTIAICLCSCMSHEDADINEDTAAIIENAKKYFGVIDPKQNWSSIKKGSVSITANADLNNIIKLQILTESPFSNKNATVLNETKVKNGDKVQMVYDAPNTYDVLFAACVDDKGAYYVKAFNIGDKEVNFTEEANAASMTRATTSDQYPNVTDIKLGNPVQSFNALRAEAAKANGYTIVNDDAKGVDAGAKRKYTVWNDGTWLNDYLWAPVKTSSNGWTIDNGTIYRTTSINEDLTTIQWLLKYYLPKTNATNNKSNNWKSIVEGSNYFKEYKNHFVSDGTPLKVLPIQMNTTEGKYNSIYYYYFSPDSLKKYDTDEKLANFIKRLPKFKAVVGYSGSGKIMVDKEYLLPYYGDSVVKSGMSPISLSIPQGYLIGFLNHKNKDNITELCMNGCTYGFGPLNKEVNHLFGHYFSAMSPDVEMKSIKINKDNTEVEQTKYGNTPYGMTWTSPRIGIFNGNSKTFLCFEDGSDCNFCDMIVEIVSGVELHNDPIEPENITYTMCFEDRLEDADYDMNDVVLQGIRLNDKQIQISLIACGGKDELQIQGLYNSRKLGQKEVHKLFNIKVGEEFVNTVKGTDFVTPISEVFNIESSVCLEDFMKKISILNITTGKVVSVPQQGEPPYAIIVPQKFLYPVERCSIVNAYHYFENWAQNREVNKEWYNTPEEGVIFHYTMPDSAE